VTRLPRVVLEQFKTGIRVSVPVGLTEAAAITTELDNIELERPMTHQLSCMMLSAVGAEVLRVTLTMLDGKPGAEVHMVCADGSEQIEAARISDGIAIALYSGAAVCVTPDLLRDPCCERRASLRRPDFPKLAELEGTAFGKWKM